MRVLRPAFDAPCSIAPRKAAVGYRRHDEVSEIVQEHDVGLASLLGVCRFAASPRIR